MKRKTPRPYFFLGIVLVILISLPLSTSDRLKSLMVSLLAPLNEQVRVSARDHKNEVYKLQLEKRQLELSLKHLQEALLNERRLIRHLQSTQSAEDQKGIKKHFEQARHLVANELRSLPAKVIFRSNNSWSSSLWVDVGSENNEQIVQKNSPVVIGHAVVGVIDYVGKRKSRVKLITDSGLTPSVRAVRGSIQKAFLIEQMNSLEDQLSILLDEKSKNEAEGYLTGLKRLLDSEEKTSYLAKGEIQGSSQPFWRSPGQVLKGTGFNYDFADSYGPARDLTTGIAFQEPSSKSLPLLKVGDLLVTTGMDGVFPEGLVVGQVIKIAPLKEGDFYYDLEAKPAVENMHELSFVYVLPPVKNDEDELIEE